MGGAWITDIRHFLDERGERPPGLPAVPRHMCALAEAASVLEPGQPTVLDVRCRRRPGRVPCTGQVLAEVDPGTGEIVWCCLDCLDHGVITGWQGTPLDRRESEAAAAAATLPRAGGPRTSDAPARGPRVKRRCGLCGKSGRLIRTECCGNWICDDEDQYVMFSYARNSCSRNHRRYTLCGYHFSEEHPGDWKDCRACRGGFETEMYVHLGTNEYNFEMLPDPPAYEPTRCAGCGVVIRLGDDGYSQFQGRYWCLPCADERMDRRRLASVAQPPGDSASAPARRSLPRSMYKGMPGRRKSRR